MARRKMMDIGERDTPVEPGRVVRRLGGFGDQELAEALTLKLVKLITPIQSRIKFKEVRSMLFQTVAKLQAIASEPEAESDT